ncbi:hypothetical protein B566_EDAN014691 [Ephemera danica]|nr:hypothetical protein B566_EDAN014691 [Ephemera danica]
MFAVSSFLPLLVPATCDALSFQPEEDTMDSQLNDSNEEGLDEELNSLVDVVMTFKCKMCQHPAASKQQLLEHIVSEHVENKDGQEDDCASEHSNVDPDDPDVAEKLVFLCAQCAEPFDSLESCRRHMVEDKKALSQVTKPSAEHSEILASLPEIAEEPEITEPTPEVSEPIPEPVNPSSENSREPRAKRKTNLPKALENGYVLGQNYKNENTHYKCDSLGCIAKFSSERELDLHVLCHNTERRNFQCCECRQEFAVWKPCSIHLWRSHQCATNMKLKNHMRIHSSARNFNVIHADRTSSEAMASTRWYTAKQCHICHKTYSDAKCLKKHLTQVHRKLRPYSCPVCGHTSARKSMLQLHLRQHTGEKPYECDQCDFRTGDHNSLRRHKMRHSGKKMYQCPHCSYSCIQSNAFKNHLRGRHPDEEGVVFECSECPFRTVKEPNFIAHQGDHRREERASQLAQQRGSCQLGIPVFGHHRGQRGQKLEGQCDRAANII